MIRSMSFYQGLLLGLGIMYVFDPDRGGARRALLRHGTRHTLRGTRDFLGRASQDVDDATLAARVRAKLGHSVSRPGSIAVETAGGRVSLRGPILRSEVEDLIGAISSVRGVKEVQNRLEPRDTLEPAPREPMKRRRLAPVRNPAAWARGVQLLAGIISSAAVAYGAATLVARVRENQARKTMELEMPEYAMLR